MLIFFVLYLILYLCVLVYVGPAVQIFGIMLHFTNLSLTGALCMLLFLGVIFITFLCVILF